jgi:hypothetical protein
LRHLIAPFRKTLAWLLPFLSMPRAAFPRRAAQRPAAPSLTRLRYFNLPSVLSADR